MSFLELRQIRKTFPDGTEAVKGIDLAIERGEFVVLLGPSGCGKTTTLRMVAGLETPTEGAIHLDGRDVTKLRPSQRDVGFVFQFYALYPHMSVRGNIAFPLESIGMRRPERKARVDSVARAMGLEKLLERYPRQLSGGDQQKVSLARAVVRRPAVYLMDEPLGTLDADQRLAMREYIRKQQQEMSVTTIYVTHDQEEAMGLADRVVVMDSGRICQAGRPMEVYDRPASLFAAQFVGSPGMNFIPGEIIREDGTAAFVAAGAKINIPIERNLPAGPATLGVRPEYIYPAQDGTFAGRVAVNEYQGNFRSIHIDTGFGSNLIMRASADAAWAAGDEIRVKFDFMHTRFFNAQTGLSL